MAHNQYSAFQLISAHRQTHTEFQQRLDWVFEIDSHGGAPVAGIVALTSSSTRLRMPTSINCM